MKFQVSLVALVVAVFFGYCRAEANLHGCDATGYCPCTSNNASECHECFECYKDVRESLQAQMVRFYTLKASVDAFEASLPNGSFEGELDRVRSKLDWLDMDVTKANDLSKDLMRRLNDVEGTLDDVEYKLQRIDEYLRMANKSAEHAATKAMAIETLVNEAKTKLREAYDKLMMAANRLEEAKTARDDIATVATNTMILAAEAESEAARQYDEAMQINDTATMAYESAAEAKRKAEKALARSLDDKSRLYSLMMDIEARRGNLANVESEVTAAEEAAASAYADAMALYERAMRPRPDSGLMTAIERLRAAQTDTAELTAMLADLNSRFAYVVMEIDMARREADEKIVKVGEAVNRTGELKTKAMKASDKAQQALMDANKVIRDAEHMLNVLVNFSRVINESQTRANEALEKIGMIETLVNETIANASQILEDHKQALMDAKMALNLSCEAVDVAQLALEEIKNCTGELEDLKATVMGLVIDAEKEKERAMELNETAQGLKNACSEIQRNATEKKEEVDEAIIEQQGCLQDIKTTRDRIDNLDNRIANLQRLDPDEVAELRADLTACEDRLGELDLINMITMLESQRDDLDEELDDNAKMILDMEKDLTSLELIVGAGSQGCVFVGA